MASLATHHHRRDTFMSEDWRGPSSQGPDEHGSDVWPSEYEPIGVWPSSWWMTRRSSHVRMQARANSVLGEPGARAKTLEVVIEGMTGHEL